jgi:sugar lactone lactonase YvrE
MAFASLRRAQSGLRCGSLIVGLLLALGCAGEAPPPKAPTPAATEATQPEAQAPSMPRPAPPPSPVTPAAIVSSTGATIVVKEGIATPESVFHDVESDVYLVSNINGSPVEADDNGFISRVSPEGKVVELKWIDGAKDTVKLNAPKGMTVAAGILYVTDIDRIRKFDVKTGEPKGEIAVKGATFLNDIALGPDGTLYFSDSGIKAGANGFEPTGSDAIYKLVNDQPKALVRGKNLNGPNGLMADESGIWVVTFRGNELYNVKSGKKADIKQLPKGGLDGIVKTNDGRLLVTSWDANQIFGGTLDGEFTVVVADAKSPADIGYDVKRNRVLIPLFLENAVRIQPL